MVPAADMFTKSMKSPVTMSFFYMDFLRRYGALDGEKNFCLTGLLSQVLHMVLQYLSSAFLDEVSNLKVVDWGLDWVLV